MQVRSSAGEGGGEGSKAAVVSGLVAFATLLFDVPVHQLHFSEYSPLYLPPDASSNPSA